MSPLGRRNLCANNKRRKDPRPFKFARVQPDGSVWGRPGDHMDMEGVSPPPLRCKFDDVMRKDDHEDPDAGLVA